MMSSFVVRFYSFYKICIQILLAGSVIDDIQLGEVRSGTS